MGVKSTRHITRSQAIDRINRILSLTKAKDYRAVESETEEDPQNLEKFVDEYSKSELVVDKWTNRMLENLIDKPFFRHSEFDNYIVEDDEGADS